MNKQIVRSTIVALIFIIGASVTTLSQSQAYYIASSDSSSESEDNILPELLADFVLEDVSQISGLGMEELKIVDYKKHTWPDGCMGLEPYKPPIGSREVAGGCTRGGVSGWIVTVESETQKWIYHASYSGVRLASHSQKK
ncbi:MAG: hypothetical protein F6K23_37830 [Okeania sp. SIO2C9]|uniref:hypothetical protein n=1 Tax=Okeania sp. SIO2C9 TaxID=2607791 RepID=UPI0013C280A8|nr:hypothetical protein [Okeania sp. SIO2C9]NEQ78249.1 hypothetical protein [Okeania sp. SIO2C9]